MGRITVGLCVLALFASANAFYPLIPEGKELVYHYQGLMRAGSHLPANYASAFILEGDMHLQTDKNSSFVRFTDLKYKLHNGEYDEWHEFDSKEMDIPKELEVFEHPFKVVYEPCGHVWGIAVEADEPQYSVNMKRGIASILQMYTEKIEWSKPEPYAFKTKEQTLYGKGDHYYTLFPSDEHDLWTVKKMAEPHTNFHLYSNLVTNTQMGKCDRKYDEPLNRDSNQEYTIVKKEGAWVMDRVESNAGIFYVPFAGEGYTFYIHMNQTMSFKKMEAAAAPMTLKSEKFHDGLTYYTADFNTMEGIANIFNGRRTFDQEKMLVELEEMLYDTMKYINEFHLDLKKPDFARGQLINRMLLLMFQLDQEHLEQMTAKLMQKTTEADKDALHAYYHMLPMIGSHASYMYMMKLMKTKKVKDPLALEWIHNMPFYAKEPNKMLIDHMSEMLNWGEDVSLEVRKAAILAFGTFVEKAMFRHNKLNHFNNWTGHGHHDNEENFTPDHELDAVFPGKKYYEKYIAMLGEKMKAAKDVGLKSVYMSALYNTRMQKGMDYLLPIAHGELFDDHYLRLMAVKYLGGLIHDNDELVYKIFWPIMADYSLPTNLRVAAYYQIMKTHPSLPRMANLLWQMYKEENVAFYQFHYSFLLSMAHSTDPCVEDFQIAVKQILKYSEKPDFPGVTGHYEMDYLDSKYEYGHQFTGMLVKAPGETETTLKVSLSSTFDNAKFPLYGLMIHVDGMDASIFEDVMLYMKDNTRMLNFEKVWKAYTNLYNNKDIRIDIGYSMYGQIVWNCHYDASNIKELSRFVDWLIAEKHNYVKKYFTITYPMQSTVIMPTEMGFPALFKLYIPKVYFFDWKINKETVNNIVTWQYDTHMKEWMHGTIGLSFYNPFIDMYQGVHKVFTFDWVQPFYFDMSYNPATNSMKLSWKRHDDPIKDTFGMKTYGATFTYVRDDFKTGLLQKSCPHSQNWEMVTIGDEDDVQDTSLIYDNECSHTGYHQQYWTFDSDKWVSNMSIHKDFNYLHADMHIHTSFGKWFLTRFHALQHSFMKPYSSANGILIRHEPSKTHPVTNIDLNLRFVHEYKHGDMMLFPGAMWNIRGTWSVKNKDTIVKSWDATFRLETDLGHKKTSYKGMLTRVEPGEKEWKVCFDGTKKYTENGLEAEVTVSMDHAEAAKCTKDQKVMEITLHAEKLEEQKDNKHWYGECQEYIWSDIHEMNSLDCFLARDTLRRWTYDIKTYDMPAEGKKMIYGYYESMKHKFWKYFTQYDENSINLEKGTYKVVTEYPLIGEEVDIHVYTPEHDLKFGGIPAWKVPCYNWNMLSTEHFSPMFQLMHKMGWTQTCEIHQGMYYNATFDDVEFKMPEDWTMYLGDAETDGKHGIWMKNIKGEYAAMKMLHGEHALEIIPTGHKTYDVMVDGKKLPEHTYQYEQEWFWMDWIRETGVVSVFCMHTGSHIVFDGHHLYHEHPNTEMPMYGKCA